MLIRPENQWPRPILDFLKRCCRFVSQEWPHAKREPLPDEGFEERFRESCTQNLPGWSIAPPREMRLGAGLDTLSGTLHEVDIVARTTRATATAELKNLGGGPGKNDIIVFYAKILDYLLANPDLAYDEICLAFVSRLSFDQRGLSACLGLGIHPIASDIRPLPVLINNAMSMQTELDRGLQVDSVTLARFEDFCADLNRVSFALRETWLDHRCDYVSSEDALQFRGVDRIEVDDLALELRQVNNDCLAIYSGFRHARRTG